MNSSYYILYSKKAQAIAGKIIILFYRLYDIILMANQPNGHIRMLVEVGTMKGRKILLIFCTVVFIYSSINILDYFYEGYKNKKMYQELANLFPTQEIQYMENSGSEHRDALWNEENISEKFAPLLEINPEVVGWITIPGTVIDYPVVQTDNNEYYLSHDINGNKSKRGAIFMDYRNTPNGDDKNTILYGHHMRDGSMFKDITKYKDKDFFDQNTTIWFYTLSELTQWEVFSAYVTDTEFNYLRKDFESEEDYLNFINTLKNKSMHNSEVELSKDDKIITLSTCSYEFDDARFVVHARRTK